MNLADLIVSAVIKKGIVYEARNTDICFLIPQAEGTPISVQIQAEHMSIRVEKGTDEVITLPKCTKKQF